MTPRVQKKRRLFSLSIDSTHLVSAARASTRPHQPTSSTSTLDTSGRARLRIDRDGDSPGRQQPRLHVLSWNRDDVINIIESQVAKDKHCRVGCRQQPIIMQSRFTLGFLKLKRPRLPRITCCSSGGPLEL